MAVSGLVPLVTAAVVAALCLLVHAHDVYYVITTPKLMRPGLAFDISVSLTENSGQKQIRASFVKSDRSDLVNSGIITMQSGESRSISLMIPVDATQNSYDLIVTGKGGGGDFSETSNIKVESRSSFALIQTDKAVYKPADKVRYRALVLSPNLKPKMQEMELEITDPKQNKISVMTIKPEDLQQGVYTGELQLTEYPMEGTWEVKVTSGTTEQTKSFNVEEYVLPKYEVKLMVPNDYIPTDESLTITVSARYTYGQPVKGRALIHYSVRNSMEQMSGELVDGEFSVVLSKEDVRLIWCRESKCPTGSDDKKEGAEEEEYIYPRYNTAELIVRANVTEALTNKQFAEKAVCQLTTNGLSGKITGPETFKSNLPYTGMVELTGPNGGAPRALLDASGNLLPQYRDNDLELTVEMYVTEDDGTKKPETETLMVPYTKSGRMKFVLDIDNKFETININGMIASDSNSRLSKTIKEFSSRDAQSLQVSLPNLVGKVKDAVELMVKSTQPMQELYIVGISKGVIVTSRHITFTATMSHTLMFQVDKAKMAPSMRLLVYTFTEGGEIIPDSVQVDVDGLFSNEVSVAFDKSAASPGDDITLSVSASPNSFVAILAVDKSVQLLRSGNDITIDEVTEEVEKFDSGDVFPACRGCMDRRKRSMIWPGFWGVQGTDAASLFETVGVNVITDAYVHREEDTGMGPVPAPGPSDRDREEMLPGIPGVPGAPGPMPPAPAPVPAPAPGPAPPGPLPEADKGGSIIPAPAPAPAPRTVFPETWLWHDITESGDDGIETISATVPDTLTTWIASAFAVNQEDGFGLSDDPATVLVSKDFFVSLTLPYSTIRGEMFKLQILVFNYKEESMEVTVTLFDDEGFTVRDAGKGNFVKSVTVPGNDAVSVEPWIVPKKLGQIKLKVMAQSANSADAVERRLLVEPECVMETYSVAKLIDLSGDDDSVMLNFAAEFPENLVQGSEYITLSLAGDLMGPSLNGLERLIRMPYGCGEQNMISFTPNIYALNYMEAVDQETPKIKADALRNMNAGYQRELNYLRSDDSFSAFGNRDAAGSTWLTAFVVKSFRQAKKYIYIDDQQLSRSLKWMLSNFDAEKRTFHEPENGRVIHTEMQGGTGQGIGLTAYVLMAFLENKDLKTPAWDKPMEDGLKYLEEQLSQLEDDPLAVALITYVLHLNDSPAKESAYELLMSMKIEEGGHVYWKKASEKQEEQDMDEMPFWRRRTTSTSSSIEMTSYALLVMAHRVNKGLEEDRTIGLPTMKYLASERNDQGGFHSTQDTVMALYALSEYASLFGGSNLNMEVSVKAGAFDHKFTDVTPETAVLLQTVEIPVEDTGDIEVTCTGQGTGLVQLNVRYHACESAPVPGVNIKVESEADKVTKVVSTNVCASWGKNGSSGMFVVEMAQLSSYQVLDMPELLNKYRREGLKRVDTMQNKLILYFDELPREEMCFGVRSEPTLEVADLQMASVEAYSYYKPELRAAAMYLPKELAVSTKEPDGSHGNQVIISMATIVMAAVVAITTWM